MSGPVAPPLEVTEVDGSPDGRPITKIIVSNGDLSISGREATIDTSGSATVPGTPAQSIQFNSDPAGTFTGSSQLLYETGSNAGRIEMSTGLVATQAEIRTMTGRGLQLSATDTDESIRTQVVLFGEADSVEGVGVIHGDNGYLWGYASSGSTPFDITTGGATSNLILSTSNDEDKAKITLTAGADGDIVIQTDNAGVLQLTNTTTDADSIFTVTGNGTGTPKVKLENGSMAVQTICEANKKFTIEGGNGGDTFVFDVSSATGGITWPDGTEQITASSGGTPAGSDTEIQFNNGGAFGAASGLVWDGTYLFSNKISSLASTDLKLYGGSAYSGTITILNGFGNHITITPSGTGDVKLQADQIIVGDSSGAADAIITTDGAGDLTLSTNKGTNSGTIVIEDGVDGDINLTPNGDGGVVLDSPRFANSSPPSSASDTGTAGAIAYDASYIYVCTATDTWERVAIATW